MTCHARPVAATALCVCVHLTWVRCCRTPLHGCQKRVWCIHSTVQLGKACRPLTGLVCSTPVGWGRHLGADNAALFILMSQADDSLPT